MRSIGISSPAAFEADTRAFMLCNPHNPVGRVFRRDELERMAEVCLARDVVICSDEIHSDLLYRGQQHTPIASLAPEIAQHAITFIAPSKTFNMPGLQASIAIIQNAELRQRFQAARQMLVHGHQPTGPHRHARRLQRGTRVARSTAGLSGSAIATFWTTLWQVNCPA